uniref:Uncharacterized protein n=1 Tax=Vespula pensylvanica TaxID=30213 RepID=A0A834NS34_VESPE|nr:hypothetical protein H0235_011556 [Vespula pensylvanica]
MVDSAPTDAGCFASTGSRLEYQENEHPTTFGIYPSSRDAPRQPPVIPASRGRFEDRRRRRRIVTPWIVDPFDQRGRTLRGQPFT